MTDMNYSTLDEPSLRNLLEGTVDMDERRAIRTAIRELRRREIEDMEAALRSKRFRHGPHDHDDKENQLRSELAESLKVLSGKLQSIHDTEELTRMLRAATSYEERKLIRGAIRREREQEIQGATAKILGLSAERRPSQSLAQLRPSSDVVERENSDEQEPITAQVNQLNSQSLPKDRELHPPGSSSDMVLVLDPLVRDKVSPPPGSQPPPQDSPTSDPEVIPSCPRQRCDSGQSDRSMGSFGRRPSQESQCSERSAGSQDQPPLPDAIPSASPSPSSTDSELEQEKDALPAVKPSTDAPDGAALSRKALGTSSLSNGLRDTSKSQMTRDAPLSTLTNGKETGSSRVAAPLARPNSIRDRMRKFTEPTHTEAPPPRRGLQRSVRPLSAHLSDRAMRPEPQAKKSPSPVTPPPATPIQSQRATGGPSGGVDAGERSEGGSPEAESPETGRASPSPSPSPDTATATHPGEPEVQHTQPPDTQRQADAQEPADDMKTFLTIEIKDGRTTISQPQARTITHATTAAPQRAELTLGLRATPFKISTQSISTGPSFKLESEPAMFVVDTSVPNGSAAKSLTSDQSRSSSNLTRAQEHTIHLVSDQSQATAAQARTQEHTFRVVADQSQATPAPARMQERTFCVIADQSQATPAPARTQERTFCVIADQSQATPAPAKAQERTFCVVADQSQATPAAAKSQEHTIRVVADQSKATPVAAKTQEHTIRVISDQSQASSTQVKAEAEQSKRMTAEQLAAIEDEELLDKMLDESKDFEERKLIRAAMRDLRKKKRDMREKERDQRLEELRKQREERAQKGKAGELVTKKVEKSADGSTVSQVTKTNRFAQSDDGSRSSRSTTVESSYVQKTDKGTVQSKSYSYSSSSSSSSSAKKVGSVFDREDDSVHERRQQERRKELMRAQTMPKSTGNQARKAMVEKLDAGGAGNGQGVAKVNKVQRSTSFGVPNASSIKQMLLDWCRAKTRSYENVEIQNFSTSWCNGMAFCALVHNFFPEAFDYESLSPANRRQNFQLAFSTAEELADVPRLLDVEDMVRMREPDWKCVYTYLQEFYRGLVLKGLVKTKGSA